MTSTGYLTYSLDIMLDKIISNINKQVKIYVFELTIPNVITIFDK